MTFDVNHLKLLEKVNFKKIKVLTYFHGNIMEWLSIGLEKLLSTSSDNFTMKL